MQTVHRRYVKASTQETKWFKTPPENPPAVDSTSRIDEPREEKRDLQLEHDGVRSLLRCRPFTLTSYQERRSRKVERGGAQAQILA